AEESKRFHVLAELTRLRRAACHPRLVAPEFKLAGAKLEQLLELVQELKENHHRALVFSQFTDYLAIVREAFDAHGVSYQYLDGSTSIKAREIAVREFQNGSGDVFLLSLKAGGVGLNLTAADYVIHLDPWWNPAVEQQATDRAHRIGQTRPVTVYKLVVKGSIEEQILSLHGAKRELVDSVLGEQEMSQPISVEELVGLLQG
ncbi:MAG: SWF/SNF helicase family protein, partial [Xanthomonadales bacterium]|nr:SWF/SNF helicase family protein [Xanthomonadales bacterium]